MTWEIVAAVGAVIVAIGTLGWEVRALRVSLDETRYGARDELYFHLLRCGWNGQRSRPMLDNGNRGQASRRLPMRSHGTITPAWHGAAPRKADRRVVERAVSR